MRAPGRRAPSVALPVAARTRPASTSAASRMRTQWLGNETEAWSIGWAVRYSSPALVVTIATGVSRAASRNVPASSAHRSSLLRSRRARSTSAASRTRSSISCCSPTTPRCRRSGCTRGPCGWSRPRSRRASSRPCAVSIPRSKPAARAPTCCAWRRWSARVTSYSSAVGRDANGRRVRRGAGALRRARPRGARRGAHRHVGDPGHARRRADHEHAPGRLPPVPPRVRPDRGDPLEQDLLHHRLHLRHAEPDPGDRDRVRRRARCGRAHRARSRRSLRDGALARPPRAPVRARGSTSCSPTPRSRGR